MISSPKAIGNSILSAAEMGAFTIPGSGPFIAAAFAGAQAIFDIFFDFDGDIAPGDMAVTANELQQAVNDIKAAMHDDDLKHDMDTKFTTVHNLLKNNLAPNWDDATAGKGPAFVGSGGAKISEQDWLNGMTKDLQDPITGTSPLLDATTFCTDHPSIKYDSLSLFIYAATAYVLFCKINVMWEYARIVRAHDFAQQQVDTANQGHAAAYRKWMTADKATRGPAPTLPPALEALLPKDQIEQQSHYVQKIHYQMDKTFIPHLEQAIDDLQKEFMDAHTEFCARATQVTYVPPALIDTGTARQFVVGDGSPSGGWEQMVVTVTQVLDDGFNEKRRDAYVGMIKAEVYQRRIQAKGLQDFTVPVRLQHKAILKHWKQCRDNAAQFLKDYPVPAGS